ncbi:Mur ligase [Podospora australis]|uniref:Mur ligase n=1 Tax=Podospora australis TaxID=1536484 RepID=A0AAN7ANT2_9PEZI|nr:Mur ligase [Podospora australis]
MIDLGLARIGRLIKNTPQTWKAIHVAGTNGKGSICAYLSAMLNASGLSCARFTSPHLVDRWDCIAVNGKPVSESLFREVEEAVKQRDRAEGIGATEFELLTATAFEIFERHKVEYGVVEVGLGGKLDATNALKNKSVTVIAKIGLDHQTFLGSTIEEIALQKAGIMRKGVPCVVDHSNVDAVRKVIEDHAREVGADLYYPGERLELSVALDGQDYEPHQIQNMKCAYEAFRLVSQGQCYSPVVLQSVFEQLNWPGRLQMIDLSQITGSPEKVLLDGAHNTQSAEALAGYVQKHFRTKDQPVTWVLAATQGKDMDGILELLLRPGDQVAAVRFRPVDGMPWVKAADPAELLKIAKRHGTSSTHDAGDDVADALVWASKAAEGKPVVIAGSLTSYATSTHLNCPHRNYLLYHQIMPPPSHLIIVCGHGIWLGGPAKGYDEAEWLIESYKKGETPTFIEHIKAGVEVFSRSPEDSVLVFSGAATRKETPLSEAQSYLNLAMANDFFGLLPPSFSPSGSAPNPSHQNRILAEPQALDSYYNILYSLVLFWRSHKIWPAKITIVSHAFKQDRLVKGHCAAIGFPLDRVSFVGINPPGMDEEGKGQAMKGVQLTLGQWEADPHGAGEELASKRRARNCWGVSQKLFLDGGETAGWWC